MNRCEVRLTQKSITAYPGELLVFLVAANGKKLPKCDQKIRPTVKELFALGDFKGNKDESILLYPGRSDAGKGFSCRRILLVGIGDLKKDDNQDQFLETFRKSGGIISQSAKKVKADELLLVLPEFVDDTHFDLTGGLVEGLLLGNYRFRNYKKKENKKDD